MENNKSKSWTLRWRHWRDRDPESPILNPDRDWIFLLGAWFGLIVVVGGMTTLLFLHLTAFTRSVPAEIASSTAVTLTPTQVGRVTARISERAARFAALTELAPSAIDPSR